MHSHYANAEGRQRRIDAFLKQAITATDSAGKADRKAVATAFAEVAEVDEYAKDRHLFSADSHSYKVFFVFTGKVDLFIGKRRIFTAERGDILGEFTVLDPEFPHVVTAIAREPSYVASVSYKQFNAIAEKYPAVVWRNVARIAASRIRKRNESGDWLGTIADLKVSNVMKMVGTIPTALKVGVAVLGGLAAIGASYNWLLTAAKTVPKP